MTSLKRPHKVTDKLSWTMGDRTYDVQTQATSPFYSCPERSFHATDTVPETQFQWQCLGDTRQLASLLKRIGVNFNTCVLTLNCALAQMKENIKAPRHWPLCGEVTGCRWNSAVDFMTDLGLHFICYVILLMIYITYFIDLVYIYLRHAKPVLFLSQEFFWCIWMIQSPPVLKYLRNSMLCSGCIRTTESYEMISKWKPSSILNGQRFQHFCHKKLNFHVPLFFDTENLYRLASHEVFNRHSKAQYQHRIVR